MTNYYTGLDDTNSMTSEDWDIVDKPSRDMLSCWLVTSTPALSVGQTHGRCCIDLSCIMNGKKIAIEIKDRSFAHTCYNDILVEDLKESSTRRRLENGEFDAAIVVAFFTDNVFCLANIDDAAARHFKRRAPCSTEVKGGDNTYVWKDMCSLPQRVKVRYRIEEGKPRFQKF